MEGRDLKWVVAWVEMVTMEYAALSNWPHFSERTEWALPRSLATMKLMDCFLIPCYLFKSFCSASSQTLMYLYNTLFTQQHLNPGIQRFNVLTSLFLEKTSFFFVVAHGHFHRELSDESPYYLVEPVVHNFSRSCLLMPLVCTLILESTLWIDWAYTFPSCQLVSWPTHTVQKERM